MAQTESNGRVIKAMSCGTNVITLDDGFYLDSFSEKLDKFCPYRTMCYCEYNKKIIDVYKDCKICFFGDTVDL